MNNWMNKYNILDIIVLTEDSFKKQFGIKITYLLVVSWTLLNHPMN